MGNEDIDELKEIVKELKISVDMLKEQIKFLKNDVSSPAKSSGNSFVSEEKNAEIKALKEEIKLLNLDLKAADNEVEDLNNKLKNTKTSEVSSESKIQVVALTRDQIIDFMIKILERALHNVNITTPTIMDLAELQLYDLRGTVNIKASCEIDQTEAEHTELLQEFDALDNISLRHFSNKDRWVCLKDNSELFIAAVGENDNDKNFAFFSNDGNHIRLFNSLVMESWLRARKI
ncbi:MAG: hypothetical protein ACTSWY_12475 [Promethearchaeota archaeon]